MVFALTFLAQTGPRDTVFAAGHCHVPYIGPQDAGEGRKRMPTRKPRLHELGQHDMPATALALDGRTLRAQCSLLSAHCSVLTRES